jgi:protein ImuB
MFACIFVPNFSVAAVLRAEPELHACAIAIFEGKPPLEKIVAVNENAKHMGIEIAMTKAQAELCSEVVLHVRSPLQESAAHAALLDCAQSFSPCVEDAAIDTAIMDLDGMESLFGSAPKIAQAISDRAADLGLAVNVAVASTPDTAVLAARGFSSVTVIPCGKEEEQLGQLSIAVLFVNEHNKEKDEAQKRTEEILATFERWGVHKLRDLASLPSIALSERLGQEGLRLQQLARGAASRVLVPIEEPAKFEEAVELEFPIVLLEPLAFLLNRLLEQICARLASRALHTQQLQLTLELETFRSHGLGSDIENHQSITHNQFQPAIEDRQSQIGMAHFQRTLNFPLPMLDPKLFLKLLQLDLNAHPPGAPIKKIYLIVEPVRPRSAQGGLFLPPSPEPEKLQLTLARIANIVGESRTGSVELLDTHRAEGFRMHRFAPSVTQPNQKQKCSDAQENTCIVAALRMFRPPLRAKVALENNKPARVTCAKKKEVQGTVLWKAGPWRSSGDWWEREAWSRDEWDIALQNEADIALYRLVHDLLGGGWFVEGTYD